MTQPTVLVTSRSFSSGDLDARGQLESAGVRVVLVPPIMILKPCGRC